MYKRDTKVMFRGEQWYYIGQDQKGDHLLSKGKGYTGPNDCTNSWFGRYVWMFTGDDDRITLVEPIPSPLENAIEEYKREHGIVGTRPFKVLLEPDNHYPDGLPSTWYRFKGTTLEYEYTNGWNKAQASELCLILFNTTKFLYLKGDEPRMETPNEWTPKIGDKVRILPRKDGQEDVSPCYVDKMTELEGSVHTIIDTFAHINGNVYFLETIVWKWRKEWLEHVE